MLATPRDDLKANTPEWETIPHIAATGFREYDARWKYGVDINLMGFQALGMALGTMVVDECAKKGVPPRVVVGHDYRDYSLMLKHSLIVGLMTAGCAVNDIGLALSPVAYFAQFAYDCAAVAMVTASHNEKPWTGVKMGIEKPLTFGPAEMNALKEIALGGKWKARPGGSYVFHADARERYIADLLKDGPLKRRIRAVVACGNGTAAHYAPEVLAKLGVDVVPLDTELDYTFPRYNPNPEDHEMLHAMSEAVKETGAELALGFDGDGDRCGVVAGDGEEIFADKIGVMLARDLSALYPNRTFVADVKSTGLYAVDTVLKANGAKTDYWMTGHSHIKRRNHELGALAAFEKSGHFFFNAPIGRGYDDGLVSAIAVLRMMERNPGKSLAQLYAELPVTHATTLAGSVTLIGAGSNLLIAGIAEAADIHLTMFSFVPVAVPVMLAGWATLLLTAPRLQRSEAAATTRTLTWQAEITLSDGASGIGRVPADLGIQATPEFELVEVRRRGKPTPAEGALAEGDVLVYRSSEAGVRMLWGSSWLGLAPQDLYLMSIAADEATTLRELEDDGDILVVAAETEEPLSQASAKPGAAAPISSSGSVSAAVTVATTAGPAATRRRWLAV